MKGDENVSKYSKLCEYLSKVNSECITLTYSELEEIIGDNLPMSAGKFVQWWENDYSSKSKSRQCRAWIEAGWETVDIILKKSITFQKKK